MELNKIYNMDCLEYIKTLPDNCIDLIIVDAPYFSTNIEEVGDNQWQKEKDYIDWVVKNFKEHQRILKNNGSLYFFHNDINIMVEILYKIKKETNFKLKNQITWDKLETGNQDFLMPLYKNSKLKRRYATSLTEYIYYFTLDNDETGLKQVYDDEKCFIEIKEYLRNERNKVKKAGYTDRDLRNLCGVSLKGGGLLCHYWGKKQWMLPIEKHYKSLQKTGYFQKPYEELRQEYEKLKEEYEILRQEYENNRYIFNQPYLNTPKNIDQSRKTIRPYSTVWHYERNNEVYEKHLTPKPVEMIKHILDVSSREGDLVFIPFAGSGSDIIACIEMNRNYLATEINKNYIDEIIIPRIKEIE